jgi:hypothetical protein
MPRDATARALPEPEPAECQHPSIHWHPPKRCPGHPDGGPAPAGAEYWSQGGHCRRCRLPMARVGWLAWGDAAPVPGADPLPTPNDGRQWTARRRYG